MSHAIRTRLRQLGGDAGPVGGVGVLSGVTAVVVGAIVILGWLLDLGTIKSLAPGLATMKFNTALCFLLEGVALFFTARRPPQSSAPRAARILAGVVLLVGLSSLLSSILRIDLGIDEMIVSDPRTPPSENPGRMAVMTAVCHSLIASALLGMRTSFDRWSGPIATCTLVISGIASAGYVYGVPSLYAVVAYSSMALHTAGLFLVLGTGLLCVRWGRGAVAVLMSATPAGTLARGLLPASLFLPLLLGWGWLRGSESGLFSETLGIAMLAVSSSLIFGSMVSLSIGALHRSNLKRAQAEQELKLERGHLELMLAHVPAGVVVLDLELRVVVATPRWMEDWGLAASEVLGRPFHEIIPEVPEHWKAAHRDCLGGESLFRDEEAFERASGKVEWIRWAMHPWRDAEDGVTGVVIFCERITDRKTAEESLHQREEQLRQAQRMEALGRLAGGVAHDFNNLLTVIIGLSELNLEDPDISESIRSDIKQVHDSGRRAQHLTRQLLAFSRKQVLRPKLFDMSTAIRGMSELLMRVIGEDVILETHLDPTPCHVQFDKSQLEQILINLAVNARDAMPQGGHLTIETTKVVLDNHYASTHQDAREGPHVMLSVSDTGLGMDAATRARIFEPFFTTKSPGEGTGLGLATVFGIVNQGGGNIWVYSEVGKGTTFKVYLPQSEGTPLEVFDQPVCGEEDVGGHETILVVEDEDMVRDFIVRVLENAGYEVLETGDTDEARRLCENHPGTIHLLFTDVVMPKKSGCDVAEELKCIRPNLLVLYMSGYTDEAIAHHGMITPQSEFLEKPIAARALRKKIREVLDHADPAH